MANSMDRTRLHLIANSSLAGVVGVVGLFLLWRTGLMIWAKGILSVIIMVGILFFAHRISPRITGNFVENISSRIDLDENSTPPEWSEVLPLIERLACLSGLYIQGCATVLNCDIQLVVSNRFESRNPVSPFKSIDIRKRSAKAGIIVLDFHHGPHLEFYAAQVKAMGTPIDINIVSPPIADPNRSPAKLSWDSKNSWCFEICRRKVWFGFEELGGVEKLVSVAIHFDMRQT